MGTAANPFVSFNLMWLRKTSDAPSGECNIMATSKHRKTSEYDVQTAHSK
jgi:hypothetical protein